MTGVPGTAPGELLALLRKAGSVSGGRAISCDTRPRLGQ